MQDIVIKVKDLKKKYKLGTIGGATLTEELQTKWALKRGKKDSNAMVSVQTGGQKEFWALNGVSFEVRRGEALGIIGFNGAGKSTLLKILSEITAPTEGEVRIKGRISSMLEVGTGFHGELTGRENIYLNGAILGMSRSEVDSKINEIIEFSECGEFIDTPVKRYSSGMYVKLAFAVAAHLDSEILIMDEVLAVGDVKFQQKCINKMCGLIEDKNKTILYVSHNMQTVHRLCNRVIVLEQGRIVADGGVEQGIARYMGHKVQESDVLKDLNDVFRPKNSLDKIHILSSEILGKESAVFSCTEKLKMKIAYKVLKPLEKMKVRITFVSEGVPICTSLSQEIQSSAISEKEVCYLSVPLEIFAVGSYSADLCFFEENTIHEGVICDYVQKAITFSILPNAGSVKWDSRWWGNVQSGTVNVAFRMEELQ